MNTIAPLSLVANAPAAPAPDASATLLDLMYDGFYALFMLKNGSGPQENAEFQARMTRFLDDFGRNARRKGASADDIDAAKYAFAAAVDEIILRSTYAIRDSWELKPLQLTLFGDQLAGENFFNRLEQLRSHGAEHLEALEVFHMCLLLGFQGRYPGRLGKAGLPDCAPGRRNRPPERQAPRLRAACRASRQRDPQAAQQHAAVGHERRIRADLHRRLHRAARIAHQPHRPAGAGV